MDLIRIGVIVNTFGLKGEVKIKSFSDFDDERYKKNKNVILIYNDEIIHLKVNTYRVSKGINIVSFKDYDDINKIEKFKGLDLFIDRETDNILDEGELYRFELIGLKVYDDNDNYIGEIINVEETGANNNLRIQMENKTILIPYVDQFVKFIDKNENKMIIHIIEGIL